MSDRVRGLWGVVCLCAGLGTATAQLPDTVELEAAAGFADWQLLAAAPADAVARPGWVRPEVGMLAALDFETFAATLSGAPDEFSVNANQPLVIALPTPDGGFERFAIVASAVMAPELAAEFPDIRTYAGYGIDDAYARVRLDTTPAGFHAQVLTPGLRWYIDPFAQGDVQTYSVYYSRDLAAREGFACELEIAADYEPPALPPVGLMSGDELRTYRVAVAATGEYTAFHGGTVSAGQAAIVTAMNRVTGVYERDVAARMVLVPNNSQVVYTNSGTDPYTNGSGSTMLSQNQSNLDAVIGSANYDIGHVFSTGGGGVASLGVVCVNGSKARGVTGQNAPIGDPFYIDYVAHEMGHQFGGNHTFNGTNGSCSGGNRSGSHAYEPGSGTTIQAYAGICGPDDLQSNSDAHFHAESYREMRALMLSKSCHVATPTGNVPPTVDAGPDYTVPAGTPFRLTAAGNDPDGGALTYCWEEFDLGPALSLAAPDNGASPMWRSWPPEPAATRYFPRLAELTAGTSFAPGEEYFTAARIATFRVLVRDNELGGGGVDFDDMRLTVDAGSGPFVVTAPAAGSTQRGSALVTWTVNGTAAHSPSVDILLSTDGGLTYPTVLLAGTPNDGAAAAPLPAISTTQARIMVAAAESVFFNLNPGAFTVEPAALRIAITSPVPDGVPPAQDIPLTIEITPDQENLVPGSEMLFYNVDGGAFTGTPLTGVGGADYVATVPGALCDQVIGFYLQAEGDGGSIITEPGGSPANAYSVPVVGVVTDAIDDDFEADQGWTTSATATSGQWQRGVPVNDPSWSYDPASDFDGSGSCYLTGNAPGNTDVDGGAVVLESPLLDMSGGGEWVLSYGYYLRLTNLTSSDGLTLDIRDESIAGPWIRIADHAQNDTGWRAVSIDQPALDAAGVTLSDQMRLRFTATDADPQSIVEAGVDAVLARRVRCENPTCPTDFDGDGTTDLDDLLLVLTSFGVDAGGDVNGDGLTDLTDLLFVLGAFGPCV